MKFENQRQPILIFFFFASILFMVISCPLVINGANQSIDLPKGQTLYTQFSLFYEVDTHITTNYRKGFLVPVNTKVKLVTVTKKTIVVTLPSDQNLTIQNVEGFSGENIKGIFARTLSKNPVDLSQFTPETQKAIKEGQVKPGMSKAAVIVALGYPPKHKTPTLELNQWRYWQNRFGTFVVHFENDQVVRIQN